MIELETIPKGWVVANFNECCENISLNGIKIKQKQYLASGKFPVIDQGRELIGGYFNDELLVVPNEPPYIVFGDHTKVKKFVTFKFIAGADGVKVLKPYDFILPNLFYYFIHAVKMPDKGYARHYQFLASEKFPIPPLNEQKRILAKLEQLLTDLDKGIEYLETTKQQLKVYRQAVLKWAFEGKLTNKNLKDGELPKGWERTEIGKVCKCIVPNRDKPKSFSGNFFWVTTPNLSENSIRIDYNKIQLGLSENEIREYNARLIPINSVIMTCVGNFGISAIVEKPLVINQQLHAFITNELVIPKYLAYSIQFNKNYFEKKSTSTTIKYLNKENCNSMPFNLCSAKEQNLIVNEIESRLSICDKIEETIESSLQQAAALRLSMIKKAFEGKLVPQDPNDEPAEKLLEKIRAAKGNGKPEKKAPSGRKVNSKRKINHPN